MIGKFGRSMVIAAVIAAVSLVVLDPAPSRAGNSALSRNPATASGHADNHAAPAAPVGGSAAQPANRSMASPAEHDGAAVKGAFHLTPGQLALRETKDGSQYNPLNWSVMIYKARHKLVVYYKSHLYKTYRAVFGRNLDTGAKEWAGDRRTPEGVYTIISKYPSRRFRWFLKLNYPNETDIRRWEKLRKEGVVPVFAGAVASPGGEIGIHGTDEPLLNQADINWTTGCISVSNGAIDELDILLPVGTLVIIKP